MALTILVHKTIEDGSVIIRLAYTKNEKDVVRVDPWALAGHLSKRYPAISQEEITNMMEKLGIYNREIVDANCRAVRETTARYVQGVKSLLKWLKAEQANRIPEGWLHDTIVATIED